jgi:hypothetical protein
MHCPPEERGREENQWLRDTAIVCGQPVGIWTPRTPASHGKTGTFHHVGPDGSFLVQMDDTSLVEAFPFDAVRRKFAKGDPVTMCCPHIPSMHGKAGAYIGHESSLLVQDKLLFRVAITGDDGLKTIWRIRHDVVMATPGPLLARLLHVGPPCVIRMRSVPLFVSRVRAQVRGLAAALPGLGEASSLALLLTRCASFTKHTFKLAAGGPYLSVGPEPKRQPSWCCWRGCFPRCSLQLE